MTKWISKASVMRIIDADPVYSDVFNEKTYMAEQINNLPVKEEARPHGEWIWQTEDKYRCSVCGENTRVEEVMNEPKYNFCPNCGASMSANDEQVTGKLDSENEYKAKVKELEDAISRCEQAEKEFKSRTCKFRSPINCDFCAFHSECEEHWKEGEDAPKSQEDKGTKKCPNCGADMRKKEGDAE